MQSTLFSQMQFLCFLETAMSKLAKRTSVYPLTTVNTHDMIRFSNCKQFNILAM